MCTYICYGAGIDVLACIAGVSLHIIYIADTNPPVPDEYAYDYDAPFKAFATPNTPTTLTSSTTPSSAGTGGAGLLDTVSAQSDAQD